MNVLELIGNTPLVEIKGFTKPEIKIYAKLESYNLGGSIKTRIAYSMIDEAEKTGILTRNKTIIEASSGNTGIGLALIGAIKRYDVEIVMSEAVSEERKNLVRKLGAKLTLVKGESTDDARIKAQKILELHPKKYWMPNQFDNPNNTLAHYNGTAVEIIKQMPEITHFVAGMGTSGTLMGCSKKLKEYNNKIKIIGVEPKDKIYGLKNMKKSIVPKIYNPDLLDKKISILKNNAVDIMKKLHKKGFLVGYSSGAAMAGAIETAKNIEEGNIVIIFPDSYERYLSVKI